jgi:outer membrane murein-binding lipoprotein Lpp
MAHTHNQDFDSHILALDNSHTQTKNEIKEITSNIATLNSKFDTLSENVKNLTTND